MRKQLQLDGINFVHLLYEIKELQKADVRFVFELIIVICADKLKFITPSTALPPNAQHKKE